MGAYGLPIGGANLRRQASGLWSIARKPTIDVPDDDFMPGSINAKWTVAEGSAGTVALAATTGQGYDLYTRPSWLLTQARNNTGTLRMHQAYTLPDGRSIIAKIAATTLLDGTYGNDDNWGPGLSLTQASASDFDDNTGSNGLALIMFRSMATSIWRLAFKLNSTTTDIAQGIPLGQDVYLRIARSGLAYTVFFSLDGEDWCPGLTATLAVAPAWLWYFAASFANMGTPPPIQGCDWIREGSNERRPW